MVLGLFVLRYTSSPATYSAEGNLEVIDNEAFIDQAVSIGFSEEDRDADGLADWEETLWGTDPENADSDGDGTLDGEEVQTNRNPMQAGPNDAYTQTNTAHAASSQEGLTATDRFAREFFTEYLRMRQDNTLSVETIRDYTLQKVADDAFKEPQAAPTHGIADIHTGAVSAHDYGNRVGVILSSYNLTEEKDTVILLNALQYNQPEYLEPLRQNATAYQNITDDLLDMVVPADAAQAHLALLNSTSQLNSVLESMIAVNTDPVRSLAAVSQYIPAATNLANASLGIKAYLNTQSVTYSPSEPGYAILNLAALQ